MMKYELTQQQWVDFLNTLHRFQQDSRTATNLSIGQTSVSNRYVMSNSSARSFRNGIRCDASVDSYYEIDFYCDYNGNGVGGEASDGQWIACNYLDEQDVWAFLDWAGFRWMFDMEIEKAGRGDVFPTPDEYAWGTTNITGASGIINEGQINEAPSNAGANANYNNLLPSNLRGPMRVGCFAGASTTRE